MYIRKKIQALDLQGQEEGTINFDLEGAELREDGGETEQECSISCYYNRIPETG
jgi:hypothetical protein